jgi:hypothetical protein
MFLLHQESEATHVARDSMPWIPFTPLSRDVLAQYHRVDPARWEIVVSMRFPPGVQMPTQYQTGAVVAHTISGAWCCREDDWVARAGDTVCDSAGSSRTPLSIGDEPAEVLYLVHGELLFFTDSHRLVWQENAGTARDRHERYCREYEIEARDLTG